MIRRYISISGHDAGWGLENMDDVGDTHFTVSKGRSVDEVIGTRGGGAEAGGTGSGTGAGGMGARQAFFSAS